MGGDGRPPSSRFTSIRVSVGGQGWGQSSAQTPPAELLKRAHALLYEGRAEEAAAAARAAARGDPASAEAHAIWGAASLEAGVPAEADLALERASTLTAPGSPPWAHVVSLRARALVSLGRWREVERLATEVERAAPLDPVVSDRIGEALTRIGLAERGVGHFRAAASALPGRPDFQFDLASGLRFVGETAGAEQAYEAAIAGDPRMAKAHMALAELRKWSPDEAHVERLKALWRLHDLPLLDRTRIGYALFKELDDLDRPGEAWPFLVQASEMAREVFGSWSQAGEQAWIDAMRQAFPAGQTAPRDDRPGPGTRFIFIVGLPRSGTTLVERILAAHSQVAAMGELPLFGLLAKQASGVVSPELLDAQTAQAFGQLDWSDVAERYRQETEYLSRGSPFAIDKLPDNFAYLGAIRAAFPDAVLIRLVRAPMDSLFGAYRLLFHKAHYWSYRQEDLARHHAHMEALAEHWRRRLGDGLIEIEYEALVQDPEPAIRRLLDQCGLSFEDACLRPHEAAGAVATASSTQIRQPISKTRLGVWRRYERELAPLQAALRHSV